MSFDDGPAGRLRVNNCRFWLKGWTLPAADAEIPDRRLALMFVCGTRRSNRVSVRL
jgi:hypothetical protein